MLMLFADREDCDGRAVLSCHEAHGRSARACGRAELRRPRECADVAVRDPGRHPHGWLRAPRCERSFSTRRSLTTASNSLSGCLRGSRDRRAILCGWRQRALSPSHSREYVGPPRVNCPIYNYLSPTGKRTGPRRADRKCKRAVHQRLPARSDSNHEHVPSSPQRHVHAGLPTRRPARACAFAGTPRPTDSP